MSKVINPATGKLITEVAQLDKKAIKEVIDKAHQAFTSGPWPNIPLSSRRDFLLKISQGILNQAKELAELETQNTGKPIKESTFMDIPSSAKTFEYFANNLEEYLKPKQIKLEQGAKGELIYEPRGVIALIIPWNYPLLIASWKLAQALAAGNTVILKPSSLTPLSVMKLVEIIKEAGVPEGVVNLVNASGEDIGASLCSDPKVSMISFTGSNETGRDIMRFAASTAKKMIMELGGKSASIVLADCDLDAAVSGALTSIFLNQGQMCTAMSRILVDKKISSEFIKRFTDKAKKIKLGDPESPQTQMGPLISSDHRKRVLSFIERGAKEGADLLCGGKTPDNLGGFFLTPAVFAKVNPQMSIFQEEIFGPVVCISEFSTEEEAVNLANNSVFGLASSIWSKDIERAKRLGEMINAGTVWINSYGMFYNEAPYGGFGQSGFGKELGKEGLLEYTRTKHITYDPSGKRPLVSDWYAF